MSVSDKMGFDRYAMGLRKQSHLLYSGHPRNVPSQGLPENKTALLNWAACGVASKLPATTIPVA
jgi:hypothetical protein